MQLLSDEYDAESQLMVWCGYMHRYVLLVDTFDCSRHIDASTILERSIRAVVLESGLEFYRLGLVLDSLVFGLGLVSDLVIGLAKCSSWSRPSPAIYAFFFLFQNKDSLVPQMGNVIAIGLTPSRTGIVIGPLLNAQLRHMSVHAAWRHKLSLFWPQTRCRQVA